MRDTHRDFAAIRDQDPSHCRHLRSGKLAEVGRPGSSVAQPLGGSPIGFTAPLAQFRFPDLEAGVRGRRVLITGAGRDGGLGQAFALAAGLGGAHSVGVHFHRSIEDGFALVETLQKEGVRAFPVQADVNNLGDLWATRSYVIEQMEGSPPDLLICNSGLTERGYAFGRALREEPEESSAMRRARVRQHFLDNLGESQLVLDTKIDGFLATTHLWAGEAVHHKTPLRIVYMSSRQAIDPGRSVPGYALSNWAVLALPRVLSVNLGRQADSVTACCLLFPFVRTSMTDEYADNEAVYGRWQSRMLEPHEAARSVLELLAQPDETLAEGLFQLSVTGDAQNAQANWERVSIDTTCTPVTF